MKFIDLSLQHKRISEKVMTRLNTVFDHSAFIMGPEVRELEKRLRSYVGSDHCFSCANGTDALALCLMAAEIGPGDEVITPAFNYFATVEVVCLLGATPVLVDICPDTYLLDPDKLNAAITSKTKAVIPVSLFGQIPDMKKIKAAVDAHSHSIVIIEDAAQSFGAKQDGLMSCSFADMATTSFFPTKPLGCYGDGGAVFTSNEKFAERLKMLRNHGQSKKYVHQLIGMNSRLDTMQAAVLLEKLEILDDEIELRNKVADNYKNLLEGTSFQPPTIAARNTSVYAQYTLRTNHREKLISFMKEHEIPVMIHYPATVDEQPVFAGGISGSENIPHSKKAAREVFSVPMYPYLTLDHQKKICAKLEEFSSLNL